MSARRIGGLLALLLLAFGRHGEAQAPTGNYVVDVELSDDINRAINDGTADLNFIKRIFARKRLRHFTLYSHKLTIATVGDSVEIIADDTVKVRARPDGSAFEWRLFRDKLSATMMLDGAILTTTFKSADGEGRNRYRLRSDGLLEVQVQLNSPRLSHAIEYVRLFRRSAPGPGFTVAERRVRKWVVAGGR